MRELGFVAALVLILCSLTFFWLPTSGSSPTGPDGQAANYATAIKAAKNASTFVGSENRRKWIVNFQSRSLEQSGATPSFTDGIFSAEGENADVLVMTSNSITSGRCTSFASSEYGAEAAHEGFTQLICRDSSTGASYQAQFPPSN